MADANRLVVAIDGNVGGFKKALHEADSGLTSFGKQAANLGAVVVPALGAALGAAGLAGGFGMAISAAADFEKTISGVKAVSGATAEEMQQLSGLALQLGKDTSFSASEAAAGIEELVKGGLTVPQIMDGAAKATLDLAAAGGVSLPDAAEIAANALAMFNLEGKDMAMVADQIAGAANASSLSVTDFKFSLSSVGSVAALAGQDFQNTATAIALMGAAGIKGSDAGTSLKTMLMNLIPTTEKQFTTMQQLGLLTTDTNKAMQVLAQHGIDATGKAFHEMLPSLYKVFFGLKEGEKLSESQAKQFVQLAVNTGIMKNEFLDAQGNFKDLRDIGEELKTSLDGLSESEKSAALEAIFGSDAIRAASVIAKNGAAGFDAMAGSMNKVTAASVGAERLNNLNGSLEQLKGSLETAAITFGMAFLPLLKDLVDGAVAAVNAMIPFIETTGPQIVTTFQTIGATIAALLAVGSGLTGFFEQNVIAADALSAVLTGLAAGGIARLVASLPALVASTIASVTAFTAQAAAAGAAAVATLAAAAPFILVGAAIAAVVFAGIQVIKNWDQIEKAAKEMAAAVGRAFEDIKQATMTTLASAFAFIAERLNAIPGVFQAGFNAAVAIVKAAINGIYTFFTETIPFWAGFIKGWLEGLPKVLQDAFNDAKDRALDALKAAWHWISTEVPAWPGRIGDFLKELGGMVSGKFTEAKDGVTSPLGSAWTWVTDNVPTWPGRIGAFVAGVAESVGSKFNQARDNIYNAFRDAWTWVTDNVPKWPDAIGGFLASLPEQIGKALKGVWDALVGPFQRAWDTISGILSNITAAFGAGERAGKAAASAAGGIQGYASGGIVPGPIGAPRLAVVHGGEMVIPAGGGGGRAGVNVTVNVQGSLIHERQVEDAVIRALESARERGRFR